MAGILDGFLSGGGPLTSVTSKVESFRPHILGDLEPKALSSGQAGSIITQVKSRMADIQAAPTIMDKVKSLTAFSMVKSRLGGLGSLGSGTTPASSTPPASSELKELAGGTFSSYAPPGNTVAPGIEFH